MQISTADLSALLVEISLGNGRAFDTLYAATNGKLMRVAVEILHNRSEAEEDVQEAFIKIWRYASRYEARQFSPISWMAAITRNQCLDTLRRRRPIQSRFDEAERVADEASTPEQSAIARDSHLQMAAMIASLDLKKQILVRAAYVDGARYEDIAATYQLPLNTVRTRLKRGMAELRQMAVLNGMFVA